MVALLAASGWLLSGAAHAQFLGHNFPGDFGVGSGTQPEPGNYLSVVYLGYDGDALRDRNGDGIQYPGGGGDLTVNGWGVGWWYVSEAKLWGGNYSFQVAPSATDNKLEIPVLGQAQSTSFGLSDLYVQPINLGWRTQHADFVAGLGLYAPTGRYTAGADDNLGMGMWSFEISGGTTVYFDDAKTWTFATTAFYEIHSEKDGTDVRVGDILTLEGGLGKSFMDGAASVGISYYAQWKVTDDDLGGFVPPDQLDFIGRNRGFGIGPEVTLPLASKNKFYGVVNLRYLWESGVRSSVEGDILALTFTFGVPPVALN
jgi:hypothetical protein